MIQLTDENIIGRPAPMLLFWRGRWQPLVTAATGVGRRQPMEKQSVILGRLLLGSMIGRKSTPHVWQVLKCFNWECKRLKKLKLLAENWSLDLDFARRVPKDKKCQNLERNMVTKTG